MKKTKLLPILLAMLLLLCLPTQALAARWEDFSDVQGHWAAEALQKAHTDGLVTGISDTELSPDTPITVAQMITILTRVLGATEKADTAALELPLDAWYTEAAALALKLGLISPQTGALDRPMPRQDALAMAAKAFALTPAEPQLSVLDAFSDAGSLSPENKNAMAALIESGLVQGFAGSLNANGSISRAEFITVLSRIAGSYLPASQLGSSSTGGVVLKGGGSLWSVSADKLWFDCTAEAVTLAGVQANALTLRGHKLTSFQADSQTTLKELIVAVGEGTLTLDTYPRVETLRLESCSSAVIGAGANNIEVTGSGLALTVSGSHDKVTVSGNGNTVTLSQGVRLAQLRITGSGNTVLQAEDTEKLTLGELTLSGRANKVSLKVSEGETALTVSGSENSLNLSSAFALSGELGGKLNNLSLHSDATISCRSAGDAGKLSLAAPKLGSLSVAGSYVSLLLKQGADAQAIELSGTGNLLTAEPGSTLKAVAVKGTGNTLTVNGNAGEIDVSGKNTVINGTGRASRITVNAYGTNITLSTDELVGNKEQISKEEVLELVTTGYKGNFTLEWAKQNDYEDYVKEAWVNARGHSSNTEYLIWINLSMQRVNIFKGSAGDWELIRESIVGSGAPKTPTPVGVWTTTYKLAAGWTTSSYTCKPVVGFRQGTGYAFHSRLYYPNSSKLKDPGIGYPISAGCIRMYDEDVQFIFNHIPNDTTVVVY